MDEMLNCPMTYGKEHADSDSASLGSNPSPPANLSVTKSMDSPTGQTGPAGTGREFWPPKNRHSDEATLRALADHEHDQLERLFESRPTGWAGRNTADELLRLMALRIRGELSIRAHPVDPSVLEHADRDRADRSWSRSESVGHCWLKEIGLAWLFSEFRIKAQAEWGALGCRYDLASPRHQIVLECGNTNIESAFRAMREPWRYFLLPYSKAASLWFEREGRRRVFIFELAMTEGGAEFLERKQEEAARRAMKALEF